jgi:cell division protease FtsH
MKSKETNKETQKQETSSSNILKKSKPKPRFEGLPRKPWYKNPVILLILVFVILAIGARFMTSGSSPEVDYATLVTRIEKKDYEKIEIQDQSVKITPKNSSEKPIYGTIPNASTFLSDLREVGVNPDASEIYFVTASEIDVLSIISLILMLVFVGFIGYSFFSAKSMAAGGGMMGFGDSKAKLFTGKKQDTKFDQIQGAEEALDEVKEIVSFLKSPDKYLKLGARIPKGVLLVGAPGTGKTLLARAIAGEADVPFFFTSGSEFEEMLVGTGASRVRDLFAKAKKTAPSIIFIDEVDSIARKRQAVAHSGNSEQTLNQILVEMDGFDKNTNVIVIAATNRADVLDPAILRPGRFDRRILLELPDIKGREEILKVHSANKPLSADVNLETVARRTIGFSGADLENTLNEAAILAAKANRNEIIPEDIEEAATKVTIGPAKKRVKSDKQKKLTAYHEAGHAIAGYFMPEAEKIHRISIVSRGYTGGVTMFLPQEDTEELRTDKKFKGELVTLYGGRSAEKLNLDSISTGASSDIQRATQIARDMVKKYGMSSLGYVDLEAEEEYYGTVNPYSEKTAEAIDAEVTRILAEAQNESEKVLTENAEALHELSKILIEKEVIEGDEFYEFMKKYDGRK